MSKECIYCGEENEDNATHCSMCGASFSEDLSRTAEVAHWFILCPCCGKRYEVKSTSDRITQCDNCLDEFDKYEIAHIAPFKVSEHNEEKTPLCEPEKANEESVLTLVELRKKKKIEISHEVTIDREASDIEPEFFKADCHISSPHCRIAYERGEWQIEDIGSSTKTAVNKVELIPFFPVAIHDGNYIRIADLIFRASVSKRSAKGEHLNVEINDIPSPKSKTWAIRCHICGTLYEVDGPSARISECQGDCKYDEFDRYEIEKDVPQLVERDQIQEKWRK